MTTVGSHIEEVICARSAQGSHVEEVICARRPAVAAVPANQAALTAPPPPPGHSRRCRHHHFTDTASAIADVASVMDIASAAATCHDPRHTTAGR